MPKVFEGQLSAAGLRFAVVVSRYNSVITERLLAGAMDAIVSWSPETGETRWRADCGGWQVFHFSGESKDWRLTRAPRDLPADAIFCPCSLEFTSELTLPSSPAHCLPGLDWSDVEFQSGLAHWAAEGLEFLPGAAGPHAARDGDASRAYEPRDGVGVQPRRAAPGQRQL